MGRTLLEDGPSADSFGASPIQGFAEIAPQLWPIALFGLLAIFVGVKRYRQTLD
jgi:hypothetical protein